MTDTIRKTNWIHFESRAKAKKRCVCVFFFLVFFSSFTQFKWLGMKQWKRFCHRFSSLRFFHLCRSRSSACHHFVTLVLFVVRSGVFASSYTTFIFVSLQIVQLLSQLLFNASFPWQNEFIPWLSTEFGLPTFYPIYGKTHWVSLSACNKNKHIQMEKSNNIVEDMSLQANGSTTNCDAFERIVALRQAKGEESVLEREREGGGGGGGLGERNDAP